MLLLPLASGAAAQLPRAGIGHGGLLMGAGQVRGSLVVIGRRSEPAGPLLRIGALAFATNGGGCITSRA